jgi:hypothetical protein
VGRKLSGFSAIFLHGENVFMIGTSVVDGGAEMSLGVVS